MHHRELLPYVLFLALAFGPGCSGGGGDDDGSGGGPPATPAAPDFQATFGGLPGVDSSIQALESFDGLLFAGGNIESAGGSLANEVAAWDGERWSALGSALNSTVHSFAVFDDGSGPAVYAGGSFFSGLTGGPLGVARWSGSEWQAVGGGVQGVALSLCVFDDGSGPALFAGGLISQAGGSPVSNIARWNGTVWQPVGTGVNSFVRGMTVFDDGSGPALYVVGSFSTAGGQPASLAARWNGVAWSALGSGLDGKFAQAFALEVFDAGAGPALYAAGSFTEAGGVAAQNIARWNGSTWSAVGAGVDGVVHALRVFDGALHAGGSFTTAGGQPASRVARFDGANWSALGAGVNTTVQALAVHEGALHVGGHFTVAGGLGVAGAARWDGASWSPLGDGANNGIEALALFDEGSGPRLHVGGYVTNFGSTPVNRIARREGAAWSALAAGIGDGVLFDMLEHDDGSGNALYVGGDFSTAGGAPVGNVARWRNGTWSAVGTGFNGFVYALGVFDEGSGPRLFAGGIFSEAGGVQTHRIARWNGAAWTAVGTGANHQVEAFCVFDDGSGPALFAGGAFTEVSGVAANRVAKWNGTTWSATGTGITGSSGFVTVRSLATFDDGSGSALFAGGSFDDAGGQTAHGIARWDGTSWSAVGGGVTPGVVMSLHLHDDGFGPALYAGGAFTQAGGAPASRVARWDGASWSPLGAGVGGGYVARMLSIQHEGAPALVLGGSFDTSPAGDSFLALWGAPAAGQAAQSGPGGPRTQWAAATTAAGSAAEPGWIPADVLFEALPDALGVALGGAHRITDESATVVLVDERVTTDAFEWIAGSIELVGGSWTQGEPLFLGFGGPARLVLGKGARLRVPALVLGPQAELVGEGVIAGDVTGAGRITPTGTGLRLHGRYLAAAGAELEGRVSGAWLTP